MGIQINPNSPIVQSTVNSVSAKENPTMQTYKVKLSDGTWIVKPFDLTQIGADVASGLVVDLTVGDKTIRHSAREIKPSTAKKSQYEHKIGSFGYNDADDYVIIYGKTRARRYLHQEATGKQLLGKLREIYKSYRAIQIKRKDQIGTSDLFPYALDIALGITKQETIAPDAPRSVVIDMYYDRTWTWFDVSQAGIKITTRDAMSALFGKDVMWIAESVKLFGKAMYFSDKKKNQWAIPAIVTPTQLATLFDKYGIDVVVNELPRQDAPAVVQSVKNSLDDNAKVDLTTNIETFVKSDSDRISALESKLDNALAAILAKLA